MVREVINHRWQCEDCNNTIGEDYNICPVCHNTIIIQDKDYAKFIKNICASCEKVFKNSHLNYQKSGNYCLGCLKRISDNIKNPSEVMKEFRKRIHNTFNVKTE